MRTALPRQSILRPALAAGAATLFVWLAAVEIVAQAPPETPPRHASSGLAGTVLDRVSEVPIAGALVELVDVETGTRAGRVESDSLGTFVFPPLAAGSYTLTIGSFGYSELSRDLVLDARVDTEVTASLVPEAMDLEPLVVTVERRTSAVMQDFERRRALGMGSFITREDIERRRPHQVTDLFRTIAGIRVVPDRNGDARLLLHGGCTPKLYIDGVASYEGTSLDMILHPDDVEAVEIYTTATTPPQYARGACGVLVVWTRVPRRGVGKTSWWKPLVLIGALAAALVIAR